MKSFRIPLPKLKTIVDTTPQVISSDFLENPLEIAYELELSELENIMFELRQAYYNDKSLVSDQIYDQLENILAERNPKSEILTSVGALATFEHDKEKVKLPYWMGSMDKVKPDSKNLNSWLQKYPGPYLISHKLDGVSALLILNSYGDPSQLYTRGNGSEGQDISHLLKYLNIFKITPDKSESLLATAVRGEIILSKQKWKKYQADNSNPRNMVSGLINAKHPVITQLQDLEFLAYEVLERTELASQKTSELTPSQQFELLKKQGFRVAKHFALTEIDSPNLVKLLEQEKTQSEYQIDGLIVTQDQIQIRNLSGNPKYSVAFKKNEAGILTTVRQVIWTPSRHGFLKPRLEVDPIVITDDDGGSVTVKFCTAFNAKFIQDNSIGPGTEIKIIRSGDVIPYITEVVKSAPSGAQMPNAELVYAWNSTGVDIRLTETSSAVSIESLIFFFKSMETKHVSQATIQKLFDSGKKTVASIINTSLEELAELPGFGQKSAERARESLDGVLKKVEPSRLMAASGAFGHGLGTRKMRLILAVYPDFGEWVCSWEPTGDQFSTPNLNLIQRPDFQAMAKKIIDIAGFQEKTAHKVVYNLPNYQKFLQTLPPIEWAEAPVELQVATADTPSPWQGQKVVFSGFRDKELEKLIESQGGQIASTVTSRTTMVITNDLEATSSKVTKAKELGLPIKLRSEI